MVTTETNDTDIAVLRVVLRAGCLQCVSCQMAVVGMRDLHTEVQ